MNLIEAAYAAQPDDHAWARTVTDAAAGLFDGCAGIGFHAIEHDATCTSHRMLYDVVPPEFAAMRPSSDTFFASEHGPELMRRYYYPRRPVATHRELDRESAPGARQAMAVFRKQLGFSDAVGIIV